MARGRRPIGERRMTDGERHKRYMARLRARAGRIADPAEQQIMAVVAEFREGVVTKSELANRIVSLIIGAY